MKQEYRNFQIIPIIAGKDSETIEVDAPTANELIPSQGLMVGHAAVFNVETDIGGVFSEMIAEGAFDRAIKEAHDVRALYNHDISLVLGRTKSGTLSISIDARGLLVTIKPPATTFANDLKESMRRQDVDQMSFGFIAIDEEWIFDREGKLDLRIIKDLKLVDVSVVTYPAYIDTDVSLREATDKYEKEKEKHLAVQRAKRANRMLKIIRL